MQVRTRTRTRTRAQTRTVTLEKIKAKLASLLKRMSNSARFVVIIVLPYIIRGFLPYIIRIIIQQEIFVTLGISIFFNPITTLLYILFVLYTYRWEVWHFLQWTSLELKNVIWQTFNKAYKRIITDFMWAILMYRMLCAITSHKTGLISSAAFFVIRFFYNYINTNTPNYVDVPHKTEWTLQVFVCALLVYKFVAPLISISGVPKLRKPLLNLLEA